MKSRKQNRDEAVQRQRNEAMKSDLVIPIRMTRDQLEHLRNALQFVTQATHDKSQEVALLDILGRLPSPETATPAKPECQHLAGYWINEDENFRCYACGLQVLLANLPDPENPDRKIEFWEGDAEEAP